MSRDHSGHFPIVRSESNCSSVITATMEGTSDSRGDLFSDPDLWLNESLLFNVTPANTSADHTVVMSPATSLAINITLMSSLIISMFLLGCTMELSKIKHHLMRPKGVAIALISQYGVMPLTAFCLCKAFQLSGISALVILICGCSPGGNLSNTLILAVQGDMNLSIAMTSCSTLLALGMMPLLLYIYCHSYPDLQRFVPYLDILKGLFMTLIPCGVGILINHYRPQNAKVFKLLALSVTMIVITVVAVLTSIEIGGSILTVLSPSFMAISALMPIIGFTLGYIISSLFRLNHNVHGLPDNGGGCADGVALELPKVWTQEERDVFASNRVGRASRGFVITKIHSRDLKMHNSSGKFEKSFSINMQGNITDHSQPAKGH